MEKEKSTADIYKEGLDELKRQHDLKLDSYQANIDAAKKNWAERHYFIFGFIMSIVAATLALLGTWIIELLKSHHLLWL
jgi:hypothetical protein